MKYIALILLLFIVSFTASSPAKQNSKEIALRKFIAHFKILKLPLRIITSFNMDVNYYKHLPDFYSLPDDTLFGNDSTFLKSNHLGGAKYYGLLPDTSDCFHVIWMAPADNYQPVLSTYSKTGKKISRDVLCIAECGGKEPCFDCSEAVIIRKDYSVYSADTFVTEKCDSADNPLPGKPSISVKFKTGTIPHSGKPKFIKEEEKIIQ